MNNTLQNILRDFGATHGIPGLTLDETGSCTLLLDDMHMLHLQYDETQNSIVLLASLGCVPPDAAAAVYGALLHANLFWTETRGATLALESDTGEIVFQFMEHVETLDALRLEQLLNNFTNAAEYWTHRLTRFCRMALDGEEPAERGGESGKTALWAKA